MNPALIAAGLSFAGNIFDSFSAKKTADKNRALQLASAKKSVQWRVADAKKAGIHPLAALGVSPAQMQPVYADTKFGQAGQDLGRAVQALKPSLEKEASIEQIKGLKLENKLKEVEIAIQQKALANNKGIPIPSTDMEGVITPDNVSRNYSPNSTVPGVNFTPSDVPMMSSHGVQAGVQPMTQYAVNDFGTYYKLPSKEIQEAISEGSLVTQLKYNIGQMSEQAQAFLVWVNPDHPHIQHFKRRWLESRPTPKKGFVAKWSIKKGSWVRVKDKGDGNVFLADKSTFRKVKSKLKRTPGFRVFYNKHNRMKKSH